MIYITGDTHGISEAFLDRFENLPEPEDTVIIAGDFGFIWGERQKDELEIMKNQPFTIAFVDGNHENFNELYALPVENWNGGKVHRVAKNIVHLMRGELFNISGKTFFTFGGAYSIDKMFRTENVSWWKQELPDEAEYSHARQTLENCGFNVDYIITHTCPDSIVERVCARPNHHDLELRNFLQWIADNTQFKLWFFGHYHNNKTLFDKYELLFNSVIELK